MKLTVKNVDEKSIKKLAEEYVNNPHTTLQSLASKYRSAITTLSDILWRGIAENIIDAKTALRIYTKIINKPYIGWYTRKKRWDEAFKERKKVIKQAEIEAQKELERQTELEYLYSLKDYYESAISSYDSYFIYEEDAPSLDSLKSKLDDVNEKIKELL